MGIPDETHRTATKEDPVRDLETKIHQSDVNRFNRESILLPYMENSSAALET
jgi:hypothetical protein